MKFLTLKVLFLISLFFTFSNEMNGQNTISIDHLEDYIWLNNPQFSPNGEQVAFTKRIANFDDNRYENSLYVYDLKSKKLQQLTNDRYGVRSLNWLSNGSHITFLAKSEDKTTQVFKIKPSGGKIEQITHHETSIVTYALSPDGSTLAFMAKDKKEVKTGRNRHLKSFEVGYDWYLASEAARSIHLWTLDLKTNKTNRLTKGEESYCTVSGNITWSPDSKNILYSVQPKPHSSEYLKSRLQTINITTKAIRIIDDSQRVPRNPKYANDGTIFYSKSQGEEFYFTPNGIYSNDKLALNIDRNVRDFYCLPNGKLLAGGADGTKVSFWYGEPDEKPQKLDLKGIFPSTSSATVNAKGEIIFVGTTSQSAPELYYMKNYESSPVKISSFNEKVSSLKLGKVENINWTSRDENKFYEDGVLTYPPNYEKGKKYPLVLFIHGGPMGTS